MLMSEVVAAVEQSLKESRITASIELLRRWLATCSPGEPEALLASCSIAMRPHVTMLMRDVLSRYPSTLLGCPVLIEAAPDVELDSPVAPALTLPYPRPEDAKPCSDLHFIGWLPLSAQLPVAFPFRPDAYNTQIAWRSPTAVVAIFRSRPDVWDLDSLEVPALWWGELFRGAKGNCRIEGKELLAYPDALEAAVAMHAGAKGEPIPDGGFFLNDRSGRHDAGVRFVEANRSHFLD